jgi:hypothetical protein
LASYRIIVVASEDTGACTNVGAKGVESDIIGLPNCQGNDITSEQPAAQGMVLPGSVLRHYRAFRRVDRSAALRQRIDTIYARQSVRRAGLAGSVQIETISVETRRAFPLRRDELFVCFDINLKKSKEPSSRELPAVTRIFS